MTDDARRERGQTPGRASRRGPEGQPQPTRPLRGGAPGGRRPSKRVRQRRSGLLLAVLAVVSLAIYLLASAPSSARSARSRRSVAKDPAATEPASSNSAITTASIPATTVTTGPSSTSSTAASTSTVPPTTTTTVAHRSPPYPVGEASMNIVESTGTPGVTRSLPTVLRYPAASGAPGALISGATPDRTDGPYPLVVFSQGFDIAPEAYATLLTDWAEAGYVVADPAYPHTSPPDAIRMPHLLNHPAELNQAITVLLSAGARHPGSAGAGPMAGLINPNEIAVIGHSDGGDVSLAVSANSAYLDKRVKAAVILSGAEFSSFGGSYYSAGGVPMLVTQGTNDDINPPSCSIALYDSAPEPKYYLSLIGAGHHSPYLYPTGYRNIVVAVTTNFLDAYLKGDTAALGAMDRSGSVAGVSTITNASSVGPPTGAACPQAPASGGG